MLFLLSVPEGVNDGLSSGLLLNTGATYGPESGGCHCINVGLACRISISCRNITSVSWTRTNPAAIVLHLGQL